MKEVNILDCLWGTKDLEELGEAVEEKGLMGVLKECNLMKDQPKPQEEKSMYAERFCKAFRTQKKPKPKLKVNL